MRSKAMGILLVCTLAVPIFAMAPAAAKNCAGQGFMHLSKKIGLPVIGAQSNVSFTLTMSCTVGGIGSRTAYGLIKSAACGRMTGGSGYIGAKKFTFQSFGTLAVVSGKVQGVFNMIPDARRGDNCSNGTADDFLVTVALTGVK